MVTIEKQQTELGRKTIIKMPIRYGYFKPEYKMVTEDKKTGEKLKNVKFEELDRGRVAVLVDLKTGKECERNELARPSVEQRRMCSIELNSETNPAPMVYKNKTRCVTAIGYISVLEYKDSHSAVFTFLERDSFWVRSTGRVFFGKPTMYQLTIREGKKSTLTKDNIAILSNIDINNFFSILVGIVGRKYIAHHRGSARVNRLFTKYFFGGKLPDGKTYKNIGLNTLTEIYRVKQNPKLSDLPWSEYELGSIYRHDISITKENGRRRAKRGERSVSNVKTSLNRYLLRGDTKQAIEACFFGYKYPKSIKKVLLKTHPLEFEYINYKNLNDMVEKYGVDETRNLITNADGTPNRGILGNVFLPELMELGFSLKQIARVNRSYSYDILYMKNDLDQEGLVVNFVPNITEYHDRLLARTRQHEAEALRQRRRLMEERYYNNNGETWREVESIQQREQRERRLKLEKAYAEVDTSQDVPLFRAGGFVFRSPKNTAELRRVGDNLNICVDTDGYLERFFEGSLGIVLVTKVNEKGLEKYKVCIETRRQQIIQAKMNSNKTVIHNKALFEAVCDWAAEYQYGLTSADVGGYDRYIDYNEEILDRAKSLL